MPLKYSRTKGFVPYGRYKRRVVFLYCGCVSVLTDSVDGRKYWNKLKQRLKAEGSELVTNCHQPEITFLRRQTI